MNELILMGRLGKDVQINQTRNGIPYARLSIATTRRQKSNNGNYEDITSWHHVTVWRKQAERIAGARKGMQVLLKGNLEYKKHHNNDSIMVAEIRVITIEVFGLQRQQNQGNNYQNQGQQNQRQYQNQGYPNQNQGYNGNGGGQQSYGDRMMNGIDNSGWPS